MLIGNTVNNTYGKPFWKLKINLFRTTNRLFTLLSRNCKSSELPFYEYKS